VVVCRDGRLPGGADESTAEAGGRVLVIGSGAQEAADGLPSATRVWWSNLNAGPAAMAVRLAPVLTAVPVVILPGSPDGRDLGPRLAAEMGRPLLAGAVAVRAADGQAHADLLRVDGQVTIPVSADGPVVATLLPGARAPAPAGRRPDPAAVDLGPGLFGTHTAPDIDTDLNSRRPPNHADTVTLEPPDHTGTDPGIDPGPASRRPPPDPEVLALIEPDPATMDLADARRVVAGGAGLVPRGASDAEARALFRLLVDVAATLGASMGATRVATDAGWTGHERQIGTTGVSIDPDLYVALGISGASQHTGGLGSPDHVVSINLDASCPMTALADLGLVTDAGAFLLRLAQRLGVALPAELGRPLGTSDPDPDSIAAPEPREETRA
jgi:electron transfer flavoprotein alpha subunit